jgi:hypothetical protein
MANRVIRDWTTSEKIDALSSDGELFFVRLIMKADDHGCFHAHPKLLKAALFPLREMTDSAILRSLTECEQQGIIELYEHDGRNYLKIIDFGQRLRNMVSKFPQPADNPRPIVSNPRPETKRNEVETETKPKGNEPDLEQFENWTREIISGQDFIFHQKFNNEFPNWGGAPEKFVELLNSHYDLLCRYPAMNPNSQQRFRASVIKHIKEQLTKQANGTGKRKGIDTNEALANIYGSQPVG